MKRPDAATRAIGPIAIVSHTIPGDLNGQAVMLDRLSLAKDSPGFVFIDTDRKARPRPPLTSGSPCDPVRIPLMLRKLFRVRKLHGRLFSLLIRQRSRAIARIVKRRGCQSIVACTGGDLVDLPAAVEAGRLTGLPTFLYYFDDYRIQWTIIDGRWSRKITAQLRDRAEPHVLRLAGGVITPNETLADDVRRRTDTPVRIVRNPVDTGNYRVLRDRLEKPPLTTDCGSSTPGPSMLPRLIRSAGSARASISCGDAASRCSCTPTAHHPAKRSAPCCQSTGSTSIRRSHPWRRLRFRCRLTSSFCR